ncbi:MAG: hypothetical protein WAX77_02890 [Methylococcaceae bacterium]
MNSLASRIKTKSRIKGEWMPIYIEPIDLSGERFTIAIAAITEKNDVLVFRTIRSELIEFMYKERADEIIGLINFSLESLENFIKKENNLKYWTSPLSGIIKGDVRQAEGVEFKHIINQGIQRCSSLSSLYTEQEERHEEIIHENRINSKIKKCLIDIDPKYNDFFNKSIDLGDVRKRRYGFVGCGYVSNIAVANKSLENALVKVMDLNDLKNHPASQFDKLELIVTAPLNTNFNKKTSAQIIAESKLYDIDSVIINDSPMKTAEYIHRRVVNGLIL